SRAPSIGSDASAASRLLKSTPQSSSAPTIMSPLRPEKASKYAVFIGFGLSYVGMLRDPPVESSPPASTFLVSHHYLGRRVAKVAYARASSKGPRRSDAFTPLPMGEVAREAFANGLVRVLIQRVLARLWKFCFCVFFRCRGGSRPPLGTSLTAFSFSSLL